MELTGTIKIIFDTKKVGSGDFEIREMVLTTSEQYPSDILIQFLKDKCPILNNFEAGESVTVGINLRGKRIRKFKRGNKIL